MYEHSLISIPFVLSKIWPGQAIIMKKDGYGEITQINIQGMIMVIVHCNFFHCHVYILFNSLPFVLSKIWSGQAIIMKKMVKER